MSKLKSILTIDVGTLVTYTASEDRYNLIGEEIPEGSIGIYLGPWPGWEKYLPGLEPLKVFISNHIAKVHRDELNFY